MATRKNKSESKFPAAPAYDIKIPRGLPKLDGTLTRKQRVEIAMDVLALLRLRSRSQKIVLESRYFEANVPESGQLHSSVIKGKCAVCARGIMFLASVDRFDRCDLAEFGDCLESEIVDRTAAEWGVDQARLIEGAFEDGQMGTWSSSVRKFYSKHAIDTYDGHYDRKPLMRAIAQNIIDNHGEFVP